MQNGYFIKFVSQILKQGHTIVLLSLRYLLATRLPKDLTMVLEVINPQLDVIPMLCAAVACFDGKWDGLCEPFILIGWKPSTQFLAKHWKHRQARFNTTPGFIPVIRFSWGSIKRCRYLGAVRPGSCYASSRYSFLVKLDIDESFEFWRFCAAANSICSAYLCSCVRILLLARKASFAFSGTALQRVK